MSSGERAAMLMSLHEPWPEPEPSVASAPPAPPTTRPPRLVSVRPEAASAKPARPASRLEQMADAAARIRAPRQETLGLLLDATLPMARLGRPVLRPLWANEAMHRAYDMVRLVARLERNVPLRPFEHAAVNAERRLARELAASFHELQAADDEREVPCSDLLRTLVRDLIELFGPLGGDVDVRTSIEPLSLPGYRRRALLLAACALVVDVLASDPQDRGGGEISVTLCREAATRARLCVVDQGWRTGAGLPTRRSGIVADLASLLEADPVYRTGAAGGAEVAIGFPVRPAPQRPGAMYWAFG